LSKKLHRNSTAHPKAVAKTLNLHIVNAILQAAHSNSALFTLAVSVTRPTEQDSAQIMSSESGSGVSWFQGRITADMVAQVNATRRMSVELRNWFATVLSAYIVQHQLDLPKAACILDRCCVFAMLLE